MKCGGGQRSFWLRRPFLIEFFHGEDLGVLCCSLASPVIGQPAKEHSNFHTIRKFYWWSLFWETLYLSSQFLLSSIWHNWLNVDDDSEGGGCGGGGGGSGGGCGGGGG